jgi:hypothetical protein
MAVCPALCASWRSEGRGVGVGGWGRAGWRVVFGFCRVRLLRAFCPCGDVLPGSWWEVVFPAGVVEGGRDRFGEGFDDAGWSGGVVVAGSADPGQVAGGGLGEVPAVVAEVVVVGAECGQVGGGGGSAVAVGVGVVEFGAGGRCAASGVQADAVPDLDPPA